MQFHLGGAPRPGDPANMAMFIQGVPYNPPFVPPFPCPPSMQQFMPMITGYTIAALQQRAQENPPRAYYFNLCSANNWQTQEFLTLLSTVAETAEFFMATNSGANVEQAVSAAATEIVTIMVAVTVNNTPALAAMITSPDQVSAISTALGRAQQLRQGIQQLQSQNRGGNFNMGYGAPVGGMGGYHNQPRRGGTSFGTMGGAPGGLQYQTSYGGGQPAGGPSSFNANSIWRNDQGGVNFNPNGSGTGGVAVSYGGGYSNAPTPRARGAGVPDPAVESVVWSPNQQPAPVKTTAPARPKFKPAPSLKKTEEVYSDLPMSQDRVSTMIIVDGVAFTAIDESQEWPKISNHDRPWDHILLDDGTQIKPAHSSGWTITVDEEHPYRTVYNPETHLLMHLKRPDGTVIEYPCAWKPNMDYLSNEIDPRLKRTEREVKALTEEGRVDPVWGLARSLKPHPKLPTQQVSENALPEEDGEAVEIAVESTKHVIMAHGLNEAETRASMLANLAEIDKSAVREYLYDEVDPNLGNVGDRKLIIELSQLKSYTEFLERFKALKGTVKDDLLEAVDDRVTAAIVDTLTKELSLDGWSIDSITDYPDLIEAMEEPLGERVIALFDSTAPVNISKALRVLDDDATAAYSLENLGVADSSKHVIFAQRICVLTLPISQNDLSLDLGDLSGGRITQDFLPELYETAKSVFERHRNDETPVASYVVRTRDGLTLQFLKGAFNKADYLIFLIQKD